MTDNPAFYLLVDPVGDQVLPVAHAAFLGIHAPAAQVLARNCVALFLDSNGRVFRIRTIEFHDSSPLSRILVWFGGTGKAKFEFADVDVSLDDFREMLIDAITYTKESTGDESAEWAMMPEVQDWPRVMAKARSLKELYALIQFPPEQECLELL